MGSLLKMYTLIQLENVLSIMQISEFLNAIRGIQPALSQAYRHGSRTGLQGHPSPILLDDDLGNGADSRFRASAGLKNIINPSEDFPKNNLTVKGRLIDSIVTEMEHDFQIGYPLQIEQYFAINFRVLLWVMLLEHGVGMGQLNPVTTDQLRAAVIRTIRPRSGQ